MGEEWCKMGEKWARSSSGLICPSCPTDSPDEHTRGALLKGGSLYFRTGVPAGEPYPNTPPGPPRDPWENRSIYYFPNCAMEHFTYPSSNTSTGPNVVPTECHGEVLLQDESYDRASTIGFRCAASAPEDELERALAASRADNDAALVAECRAVDAARIAAEADAETLAERRAAEEREREDLVISGVGAAADAARNAIVASTDALAAALFERPALKALFVVGGEAARRSVVKLLSLGRSAAKWYPLHAPAVLRPCGNQHHRRV